MSEDPTCELCEQTGGQLLAASPQWRIVGADDEQGRAFPGFTRIIWQAHRREMSDLLKAEQSALMSVVFEVEALMREHLRPDKINLASLGNHVDHLHWHVIARWRDDSHFPAPIWASANAGGHQHAIDSTALERYWQAIRERFA